MQVHGLQGFSCFRSFGGLLQGALGGLQGFFGGFRWHHGALGGFRGSRGFSGIEGL